MQDLDSAVAKTKAGLLAEVKGEIERSNQKVTTTLLTEFEERERRLTISAENKLNLGLKKLENQLQTETEARKEQINEVKKMIAGNRSSLDPGESKAATNPVKGNWQLVDFQRRDRKLGKEEIDDARITLTSADSRISLEYLGKPEILGFVRFAATGKMVDLTLDFPTAFRGLSDFPKGRKLQGIYQLKEDSLQILLADKVRPESFEKPGVPNSILMHFRRKE